MAFDALAALRQAGSPVDLLGERERAVFAALNRAEVDVLISIKQRLDTISDSEVEGHANVKIV